MSGIAGIWHLNGQHIDEAQLTSMTDAIAHRGPHGTEHWSEGPVGFGHVMLRSVPEAENEIQPLVSTDGSRALVMDGRIDNREEVIGALGLSMDYLSEPDSKLVLEAYEKWGVDVAKHLLGDFALAIWDARAKHLFLARDHFGIKPLFYAHEPGKLFAFASEVKALRAAGIASSALNEMKIAQFLLLPVEVEPTTTYYRDVVNLLPAHRLVVGSTGDPVQETYWRLNPDFETRLGSDEEYVARFRELFDQAVRCRLRSTGPVGAMMSGGLDSTGIACTAARQLASDGKTLHTFSAVFDSIPEANERKWMESTLRKYGEQMEPHFLAADEYSPLMASESLTWHMDRASEGINSYIPFELYRRAGESGVQVVLDGFDGDTTVSHGDAYYLELLWNWRWVELWRMVKAGVKESGGGPREWRRTFRGWIKFYLRHQPSLQGLLQLWRGHDGAAGDQVLRLKREGGSFRGTGWMQLLNRAFSERIQKHVEPPDASPMWKRERDHHHMLLTRPLMESALQGFDAKAVAAGVDVRFPFYDVRLVTYCLSLPGRLKRRGAWSRWIMRASMEGVLPEDVQWRVGKPDLIASYIAGLTRHDVERVATFGAQVRAGSPIGEYLNVEEIADLAERFAAGKLSERTQEDERVVLWRAMALQNWLSNEVCQPEIEPHTVGSI